MTKIKIGDLVIINQFDCPCSRLIASVTSVDEHTVHAEYLSAKTRMREVFSPLSVVTPIDKFGVELVNTDNGRFYTRQISESLATYLDGTVREWQGIESDKFQPYHKK